jgi:UMF1 family MFS transporter
VSVFTAEVLAFTPSDNILLFLVLNVIAAPGALFFGNLLDRIGGRRTIRITLVLWVIVVAAAAATTTKTAFWAVAILAAVVIGATQSSSRALMARLAPRERVGEYMGLLALSGKASAVFGPLVYGAVAEAAEVPTSPGSGHRVAILVIGTFFLVAFFVMGRVREEP